jgi:hypothetical protein
MAQEKETFLGRWSRLKREEESKPAEKPVEPATKETAAPPLPAAEDLTATSDFSAFMHPKVQDAVRRVALKKLFNDPHFNIPDPYEPFSGDWTGEALEPEMLKRLNQARTHILSEEERETQDREQLERDHAEALALDAERSMQAGNQGTESQ